MDKLNWQQLDDSGAAIIEMILVVPLILLVAAGLLDLSLLIRSELALDSAATAAVRICMDNPGYAEDEQALREYLRQVDPLMGDAHISIAREPERTESYTHHFYLNEGSAGAKRENSHRSSLPITVKLELAREYLTPLGRGISLASGGSGLMEARASQSGAIDTTGGSTW